MKQYQIDGNTFTLRVKKSPVFIRGVLFLFTFLFFTIPPAGAILYFYEATSFRAAFLFGAFIFGIFGFYLLRVSLWNTYGREIITITDTQIQYTAHYGWFKDRRKPMVYNGPIRYTMEQHGYDEDKIGQLIIHTDNEPLDCVTKMPMAQLEELIRKLEASDFTKK